jgi:hypothetical protein
MDEVPIKNKTNQDHGLVHGLNIKKPSNLKVDYQYKGEGKILLYVHSERDFAQICLC